MQIKKIVAFFAFLILITLTALSIFKTSVTTGLPSYRLTTRKTEDRNIKRTDYINADGKITYATDKHYATIIRTYEEGHVIFEEYFDAEGKPAVQTLGHVALARHYNSDGLADTIMYLDAEGQLVTTSSGYNTIHRTYNNQHLAETDIYYIGDKQVQTCFGFCSLHRAYDENKRVREITYFDETGQLTLHKNGYARITRTYNDAGKIEYEYYFDTKDSPVAVFSGYYGVYREYDEFGNTIITTYLDSEGKPIERKNGYATTVKTYGYDGTVKSIRYFDAAGNPVTIGRNQYGLEYVNGQGVYLDKNGEQMFRLDNFLNTHPGVVLISGTVLTLMAVMVKGKGRTAFVVLYILFIGFMTIAYRETGESRGVFELLWSYKQFVSSISTRQEILNNIWLFMPLGAGIYTSEHKNRWIWAVVLSILIEAIQYKTGIGLCEIDDLISNGLGALIGYELAAGIKQLMHPQITRE